MKRSLFPVVVSALLGGCAVIPPQSPYVACSGSEAYKVCERVKYCDDGTAVLIQDHFHGGQWTKVVDKPCKAG